MRIFLFAMTALLMLSLVSLVSAFGVTSFYYDGRPLEMMPGESREIYLLLQNMVGDKDMKASAKITEGSGIAEIIDSSKEYLVPLGADDVKINLRISIPESADKGDSYNIVVNVNAAAVEGSSGGQLGIGQGISTKIPVVVPGGESIPEGERRSSLWRYFIVGAIFILIIIIIIAYIRKKRSSNYQFKYH